MRNLVAFLTLLCLLSGCKLPEMQPGTQVQSSTFGLKISPNSLDGTPLAVGSHTTIYTTPQPANAGPLLNRFEGTAGFSGAHVKSTVGSGPVGEQIRDMGGPEAISQLLHSGSSPLPSQRPALVPTPPTPLLPATTPAKSATGPALATPSPSPQ